MSNKIIFSIPFLILIFLASCQESPEKNSVKNTESNPENFVAGNDKEALAFDKDSVQALLQGVWKEAEYPFRRAEFVDSTVKFIEEGIAEKLVFKSYTLANVCPFKVNNLKTRSSEDILLVLPGDGSCEKLYVDKEILKLSGYNVVTDTTYHIVYRRDNSI